MSPICVLAVSCVFAAALDRRLLRGGDDEFPNLDAIDGYLRWMGKDPSDPTSGSAHISVLSTASVVSGDRPNASSGDPVASGAGDPAASGDRHVIVAKYDEDVSWLRQLSPQYNVTIYQSHDPNGEHFVENYGNEASKYLQYIVDNYDVLPDSMMFLQAGRMDWHDPMAKDILLRDWDWSAVNSNGGMRSLPTAAPCLIEDSEEDPSAENRQWPYQEGCPGVAEHYPKQMATLRDIWPDVFQEELGALPSKWLTHCCAQFQVSRDAVQRHPKEFYERLFHWTLDHDKELLEGDSSIRRNHDPDRKDAGHLMEVSWVLLFARDQAEKLPAPE